MYIERKQLEGKSIDVHVIPDIAIDEKIVEDAAFLICRVLTEQEG